MELALNLDRDYFKTIVVIYHDIQQMRSDLDKADIPVVLIKKRRKIDIIFLFKLITFFKKEKPNIIHSYLKTPNLWARVTGKLAGVRHIITSERNIDIEYSKISMFLEKIFHYASSYIVVNADAIRTVLVNKLGLPDKKIVVIHNGIDIKKFRNPDKNKVDLIRNLLNLKLDDFIVVLPGRLEPIKKHSGWNKFLT